MVAARIIPSRGRVHGLPGPPDALLALERRAVGRLRTLLSAARRRRRWNEAIDKAAFELGWEGVAMAPLREGDAVLREAAARLRIVGIEVLVVFDEEARVWRAVRAASIGR
jgi:hypothetical protein